MYIGNKSWILPVISFMCSVHHCFHEIVANILCLNLMHPLKQAWQYIAVIICTFNSILHFCCTHIWYWFRCWFTKSIDPKFPFLLVGPRLILLWSFRPNWPSDKVRNFNWCDSECLLLLLEMEKSVKCPLSDIVQYLQGLPALVLFLCNGTLIGIGAVYVHLFGSHRQQFGGTHSSPILEDHAYHSVLLVQPGVDFSPSTSEEHTRTDKLIGEWKIYVRVKI